MSSILEFNQGKLAKLVPDVVDRALSNDDFICCASMYLLFGLLANELNIAMSSDAHANIRVRVRVVTSII